MLLNRCAEIEDTVAQIYRELAGMFPMEPDLVAIWLGMADDEGEHAGKFIWPGACSETISAFASYYPRLRYEFILSRARYILAKV